MMEDILAGLKVNRDHFCFLLGLERQHSEHPLLVLFMDSHMNCGHKTVTETKQKKMFISQAAVFAGSRR